MSTTAYKNSSNALPRAVGLGVAGGLVGGLAFGLLMASWEMLPMVAAMIDQSSAFVGFIIHMLISAFIGATFGVILTRLPQGWAQVIGAGAVYGVIWWGVGALIAMPLILGMNEMVLVIEQMQINSLIGHIVFGVLMAITFRVLSERINA